MEEIFDENQPSADSLLDDVLKKYNLDEDLKKIYQKISSGLAPNKAIVGKLAKGLIEGSISEKAFLQGLQKDLSLDEVIGKNMLADLKEKFIPFFQKIIAQRNNQERDEQQTAKKQKTPTEKTLPKKSFQAEKVKSSGADRYREKI